jgi:dihydroneopterin aldolase
MHERPLLTVGGLIIASDGDLLLVRSKKWHDLYSVPGGKVELGETREEALRREIWEEAHVKILNIRFATIQESIYSPEFWQKNHFVMNDYIADLDPAFRKDQVILNDEAYAYCWVNPLEALSFPLHREARELIKWYIAHELNRRAGIVGFDQHQIDCIVGTLPEERVKEQLLWVDLKVKIDFSPCLQSGSIDKTVDYSRLASFCTMLARNTQYELIESLASDIIAGCFEQFNAEWAWVRVRKPSAIPTAAYAFVEMEQSRR